MSQGLTSQIALTMPNAETIFFIPYFESPRRSCPSTHLLTGSFRRAAAGSLVFAHSSLHLTKYPFSAGGGEKAVIKQFVQKTDFHNLKHLTQKTKLGTAICDRGTWKSFCSPESNNQKWKDRKGRELTELDGFHATISGLKVNTEHCQADSTSDKTQAALSSFPLFLLYCRM